MKIWVRRALTFIPTNAAGVPDFGTDRVVRIEPKNKPQTVPAWVTANPTYQAAMKAGLLKELPDDCTRLPEDLEYLEGLPLESETLSFRAYSGGRKLGAAAVPNRR